MDILISALNWLAARLPAWVTRRYWTEARILKELRFDVRSRHNPITIHLDDYGRVAIYFEARNSGYLTLTIDRIILHYYTNQGVSFELYHLKRIALAPSSEAVSVLVEGRLDANTRRQLSAHVRDEENSSSHRMDFHLEIDCSVRSFAMTGQLDGLVQPRYVNIPSE